MQEIKENLMKFLILSIMCLTSSLLADELIEKKYYTVGKINVLESHAAYPVLQMIEAFKNEDVEKAKEFCSKGYIDYANKYKSLKFKGTGISDYKKDLNPKGWIKFKFYPEVEGIIKVYVAFETKDDSTATRSYYVSKSGDKWLLVAPKRK